jgi:hypothetical protein
LEAFNGRHVRLDYPGSLETVTSGKVGAHGITDGASAKLREHMVAMVFELCAETGNTRGSIVRLGHRLDINTKTLRDWA